VLGAIVYDLFVGDVLGHAGNRRPRTSEGFGETVEERPPAADGKVAAEGRTVRER
jgi:hypothetical protein